MNLSDFRDGFTRLSEANRILMLSYLADLCPDSDELTEGLQAMACNHAERVTSNERDLIDIADGVIPQGKCSRDVWEAHRAMRDMTLQHALLWDVRREKVA